MLMKMSGDIYEEPEGKVLDAGGFEGKERSRLDSHGG
jgi:hypothetical protein